MKIRIEHRTYEEYDISNEKANEIARKRLYELINPGEFLLTKNGKIALMRNDPYWRHGSMDEIYVRDATELDIAVFEVLKYLT
jgi:hypothetical protein